jgi:DNA-binding response OmpR family regulator
MDDAVILVIEDDLAIRRGVVDALDHAGYRSREAGDAPTGLCRSAEPEVSLVLLDLVLPAGDGLEILRQVRRSRPSLPVIIVSALGDEKRRVEGLELGADDYVVKPFSARELLARVSAVLRRSAERPEPVRVLPLEDGEADLERLEVRFEDGAVEELSSLEGALLSYLAARPRRVVSREELLTWVWRLDPRRTETRSVDMAIARLRRKLRDGERKKPLLGTVRGKGYRMDR